jgi:hypothetical protein
VIPAAHIGHYLWVFYLIPVLIIVGAIIRSTLMEKRRKDSPGERNDSRRGLIVTSRLR